MTRRHQTNWRFGLLWLVLALALPLIAAAPASAQKALQFDGTNEYVTFGSAPGLNASEFTLECWFYWTGGTTTSTGTGGVTAIPLVTKGRGESETTGLNVNYFLGIAGDKLAADFEAYSDGQNYPVTGLTTITANTWHHAAATYNGTCWQLYLDGVADTVGTTCPGVDPDYSTTQHAGIGTAMTSGGTAAGFFKGVIDEVRIWNYDRTQMQIQDTMYTQITASPPAGLLGCWSLNEGAGTVANNTVSGGVNGTLTNGPLWITGAPFGSFQIEIQEGLNGYVGTVDTFLWEYEPSMEHGQQSIFRWDTVGNPSGAIYGLVRFDNIFGVSAGQIPPYSTITSASLLYSVSDLGDNANVNEVLVDWDENTTFNNFGGQAGVQAGDFGISVGTATGNPAGVYALDVTNSLAGWVSNPSANRGWIFRATNSDGVQVSSSENATAANRPKLIVNYIPPPTSPPAAPTGLSVGAPNYFKTQLNWSDTSDNESGFEIERSVNSVSGPFTLLTVTGINATTHSDTTVEADAEYCYRVRATNAAGQSGYTEPQCATTPSEIANGALDFGGTDDYVTFGAAPSLGAATFTIECWFYWTGGGSAASTGSGGISAIPLVTKGLHEADGSSVDMNYFLGISGGVLAADFESYTGGGTFSAGQNFPVMGTTAVSTGAWHHAAVTYGGGCWQLYLDGNAETDGLNCPGVPPRYDSIQHAAIATAMNSTGVKEGYFDGTIDEVRIWNYARIQDEILSTINSQITASTPGLIGRWGLNEGSGTIVNGTAGTGVDGTLAGTGYVWVTPGAPFNISFNAAPNQPILVAPALNAPNASTSPLLEVTASDPENSPLTVTFFGRSLEAAPGNIFTLVALPDTQFYSQDYPSIFDSQTQWIVNNKDALNIAFVAHEGDIVNTANVAQQWINADGSMLRLDTAGVPYGVCLGNHDLGAGSLYNNYFGPSRFTLKPYFGGAFGASNTYSLFRAGGMDFIIIFLEYGPGTAALNWADTLLKNHPWHRGIVVSHNIIGTGNPATFSTEGLAIFNALMDNPNLFLLLCGHVDGTGQRADTGTYGNTIYTILSDYQGEAPEGGNGWLRIMEFDPGANKIRVSTYSPYLTQNQWKTDPSNQFELTYDMSVAGFTQIGSPVGVASGSNASLLWPGLGFDISHEWYVTVSDGNKTTVGPLWGFTTSGLFGDFFGDCDVDGSDLAELIANPGLLTLPDFAPRFGAVGCPY